MFKNIKSNRDGFTIVETLIVLAIAAVIIIIVLLAVPALQRTARNNDIKSDSSTVAGEINEFESDDGGAPPNSIVVASGGALTVSSVTPAVCGNASVITGSAAIKANIASSDTVVCDTLAATVAPTWSGSATAGGAGGTAGGTISVGGIVIDPQETCTTTGTLTPAARSFAVFYPIEGPNTVGCLTA